MTVSIWQANNRQPIQQTDVVIIGAGLLGTTAAVYLKEAGRQVTIIEARDVGLGASSRNAGFMIVGLDKYYHQSEEFYGAEATREIWHLSLKTHDFWRQIARKHGVYYSDVGSLLLAESPEEAAHLEQAARRMEAEGFQCEFLSTDPLNRGYCAAIRQPGDGELHPFDLANALFKESGAQLIDNNEVYAIEADGTEVMVYSRKAIVRARQVLICTNAYAAHLDPYFAGKVIPTRAQVLATAPFPEKIIGAVGYSDYGYMYYRDLPEGGLLLGGGRKQNKAAEDNTTEDKITAEVQGTLDAYLHQWFPDVEAHSPVIRRWSGIMGFTPDGLPMVGTLPRDERIFFALGLNGHGLSLGAGVAERAVNLMLHGQAAGVFDGRRFD